MNQQQRQDVQPIEPSHSFKTLDQLLQETPLPTGKQAEPTITADCFEFMLMGYVIKNNAMIVSFKHTISRNYLHMNYTKRVLQFNTNGQAFNQGTFPSVEGGIA